MRYFGRLLILVGVVGFLYSSSQLSQAPPRSDDASISESLRDSGGRWEVARYASAGLGAFGLLMLMFPKGR